MDVLNILLCCHSYFYVIIPNILENTQKAEVENISMHIHLVVNISAQ